MMIDKDNVIPFHKKLPQWAIGFISSPQPLIMGSFKIIRIDVRIVLVTIYEFDAFLQIDSVQPGGMQLVITSIGRWSLDEDMP